MSIDELWKLHEEVTIEFAQKLWSEEIELEQRLRHLQEADNIIDLTFAVVSFDPQA